MKHKTHCTIRPRWGEWRGALGAIRVVRGRPLPMRNRRASLLRPSSLTVAGAEQQRATRLARRMRMRTRGQWRRDAAGLARLARQYDGRVLGARRVRAARHSDVRVVRGRGAVLPRTRVLLQIRSCNSFRFYIEIYRMKFSVMKK